MEQDKGDGGAIYFCLTFTNLPLHLKAFHELAKPQNYEAKKKPLLVKSSGFFFVL